MTNRWNELERLKQEYRSVLPPEDGPEQVRRRMEQAKWELKKRSRRSGLRWTAGVAAALALFVAVPNASPAAAAYLSRLPVLGSVVRVVTLNRYRFEDETHQADVNTPVIEEQTEGTRAVNRSAEACTAQLTEQFKQDMKLDEKSFKALNVDYETVTDTEDWFTLKILVTETGAGAAESARYYNIDKATGKVVALKDLFRPGADYVTALSDDIKTQMRQRVKKNPDLSYFLDTEEDPSMDFQSIKPDQAFYKNREGKLVIAFDEYEVAPGSMGTQEFVVDSAAVTDLMK